MSIRNSPTLVRADSCHGEPINWEDEHQGENTRHRYAVLTAMAASASTLIASQAVRFVAGGYSAGVEEPLGDLRQPISVVLGMVLDEDD